MSLQWFCSCRSSHGASWPKHPAVLQVGVLAFFLSAVSCGSEPQGVVGSGGKSVAGGSAMVSGGVLGTGGLGRGEGGVAGAGSAGTGGRGADDAGTAASGGSGSGGSRTGGATGSGGRSVTDGAAGSGGMGSGGSRNGGATSAGGTSATDGPVGDGGTRSGGASGSGSGGASGATGSGGSGVAVPCGGSAGSGTPIAVSVNGNDVLADNVNGLTFKGFGVLSANGTSEVLMDYKSEHPDKYAEMLQILFGGANPIMTQVKIEMGNDRNNSTGPDAATMRTASEAANVRRDPSFQLAADAKKLNSNLKVSILRWNSPAWANSNDKIYTWYKNTILTAYRTYGYMVDYVNPGLNERGADLTWTKTYADRVKSDATGFGDTTEQALYNSIKVVISDEADLGTFGGSMVSDAALRAAVSVAGYHYNTNDDSAGNFTKLAEQLDKEIWNSEAQATFGSSAFRPVTGTGIGGANGPLEMGNTFMKGFVNSRRTHFIYQPAIGSFYEGGQYSFKELLSARDPWSGWIHYDVGLDVLRHVSWFAKVGWENKDNTAGIWRAVPEASYCGVDGTNPVRGGNGNSYLTLAAPDKRNFSTIFINDSSSTRTYKIQTTNMAFTGKPSLELWESRAADSGKAFNSNYLKYVCSSSPDTGGAYLVTVRPYSALTASTLVNLGKAEYQVPLPVEGARTVLDTDATGAVPSATDKVIYADDFDYSKKTVPVIVAGGQTDGTEGFITARGGPQSTIPRYACDRNGAFEVYLPSGSTNYVLRQQLDQPSMGIGGAWNAGNPITAIGDFRWLNYKASVDVSFENNSTQSGNNYAAIGARQQGGESSHDVDGTPYFLKFLFDGTWQLLVDGTAASSGNVVSGTGGVTIAGFKAAYDEWHNLALQVVDNKVTAYLDGTLLATYTDTKPRRSGRVDLASGPYFTRFDNLKVETVDGAPPYYSELLDDLETYDLASPPATKLVYGGSWTRSSGTNMYDNQRTLSKGSTGATLKYSFTGTGLDILGANGGSAKLEVTVDGQITDTSASTMASSQLYQTFTLRGLANGPHTVQLKVASGSLTVDSVGVVAAPIP
jgi:hypothetical protein